MSYEGNKAGTCVGLSDTTSFYHYTVVIKSNICLMYSIYKIAEIGDLQAPHLSHCEPKDQIFSLHDQCRTMISVYNFTSECFLARCLSTWNSEYISSCSPVSFHPEMQWSLLYNKPVKMPSSSLLVATQSSKILAMLEDKRTIPLNTAWVPCIQRFITEKPIKHSITSLKYYGRQQYQQGVQSEMHHLIYNEYGQKESLYNELANDPPFFTLI